MGGAVSGALTGERLQMRDMIPQKHGGFMQGLALNCCRRARLRPRVAGRRGSAGQARHAKVQGMLTHPHLATLKRRAGFAKVR